MAYHTDRNYTIAARRERADAIQEARFRTTVRASSLKDLIEMREHMTQLLAKTPARCIHVIDRLTWKRHVVAAEIIKRKL